MEPRIPAIGAGSGSAASRTLSHNSIAGGASGAEGLHDVLILARGSDADRLGDARRALAAMGGTVTRNLQHLPGLAARIPRGGEAALAKAGLSVLQDVPVRLLPRPRVPGSGTAEATLRGGHGWDGEPAQGPAQALNDTSPYTGKGVGIAILDSGVAPHPDLQGRIVAFADAVDGGRRPVDGFGHGTHVAGDAAGSGALSGGRFHGPAPDADIVGIRVLGDDGGDRLSDAVDGLVGGLQWMVQNKDRYHIRVANLSLGLPLVGDDDDGWGNATALYDPIGQAIDAAVDAGIVVVVAAGNDGEQGRGTIAETPAINPRVITVGALDTKGTRRTDDDEVAAFSSRGPTPEGGQKPDVVAPGVNVMSLNAPGSALEEMNAQSAEMKQAIDSMDDRELESVAYRMAMTGMAPESILDLPPDRLRQALSESIQAHPTAGRLGGGHAAYVGMDGTSMASPVVAGVVAQMLQANPSLTPEQVKEVLQRTAHPLPGVGAMTQGAGAVDANAAVAMAEKMRQYPGTRVAAAPTQPHRSLWQRLLGHAA